MNSPPVGDFTHEMKTEARYFARVWDGSKTAELRRNDDRDFQTGDRLLLIEVTDGQSKRETGRKAKGNITHVLTEFDGLRQHWVMLSFYVYEREDVKVAE